MITRFTVACSPRLGKVLVQGTPRAPQKRSVAFPENVVAHQTLFPPSFVGSAVKYVAVMLQELDVRLEQAILTDLVQVRVAVALYV